jgi:hypothetical protein
MLAQPITRSWRRLFRFSVRTLVFVVIVVGIGLGWIVHQAHLQRDTVAAIVRAGGAVRYNWEWTNGKAIMGGEPSAPSWLVEFLGVDYFGHVTIVGLYSPSRATYEALVQVGHLTQLQRLTLALSHVDDAALEHLGGLTELTYLDLQQTGVTDAGLANLKGLTNLQVLVLDSTRVSDLGLVHLGALRKLVHLQSTGYYRHALRITAFLRNFGSRFENACEMSP